METDRTPRGSARASRLIKILFTAGLLIFCGVTFGVFALGAREPLDHTVAAERVLPVPLDSVWARLHDFAAYPSWRPELDLVKVEPAGGDTLVYREFIRGREGMAFRVEQRLAPRRLVVRNISEKLPMAQLWEYELAAEPGGTRVLLRETGTVNSVSLRFYFRYINSHTESVESRLDRLARSFDPRTP